MSTDDKLSAKPQIDTSDFKTGTTTMNREIRILESGFRAVAAEMGDWANSATGLEKRLTTLTQQIDLQKQKVALTQKEYERLRKEQGENSRAAQDMEIKLNKETESLNKMQAELRTTEGNLQQLKEESDHASESLNKTAKFTDILKGSFAGLKGMTQGLIVELKAVSTVLKGEFAAALTVLKIGAGSMLALGSAAVLAGSLLVGMTLKAAAASDQLGELSDKTGISTKRLQELGFIGKVTGTDLETITGANARLVRSMTGAIQQMDAYKTKLDKASQSGKDFQDPELKGVAEAFAQLGVKVTTASGQMRDSKDVFNDVIAALGRIENPTERDALAMRIFGKSAQELNPLIKLGAQGMKDLSQQANDLGAVVDDKTITALGNLNDKFDILKSGAGGLGTTILGAFAPLFSNILDGAISNLATLVQLVRDSNGDFGKLAGGLGGFFTNIIRGIAGALPGLISGGLLIVKSLLKSIIDAAPELIKGGSEIIKLLSDAIIQNLPGLSQAALAILPSLIDALLAALPQVFNVGISILSAIADALIAALPILIGQLPQLATEMISNLLASFEKVFPELSKLAARLIATLIDFLRKNLVELIQIGIPLISQLIQAILPLLPLLIEAALQIVIALAKGISEQLPALIPAIVDVIIQIVQVLTDNLPLMIQAALVLIIALAQGLIKALPTLIAAMPKLINELLKAFLGSTPLFAQAAGKLIGILGAGIVNSIPVLLVAIGTLLVALGNTVGAYFATIVPQLGKRFVQGLAAGIASAKGLLYSEILSLINGMIAYIHNLLDMHSPSGVGIGIGGNFIGSIGMGGKKAAGGVEDAFNSILNNLSTSVSAGLQAAGTALSGPQLAPVAAGVGSSSVSNTSNQNVAINIQATIRNDQDIDVLAQKIKQRLIGK